MKIVPYLSFDGNCREAFDHYAKVFGGEIKALTTYGQMPGNETVPPGMENRIVNVHLVAGDQELMGADAFYPYEKPTGITINIVLDDEARAEELFNGLSEGGKVGMAFGPTFWAKKFGMATDRFGTPWMINCGIAQ